MPSPEPPRLVIDALAWHEGFAAGHRGACLDDNPYCSDPERITPRVFSWDLGLLQAIKRRKAAADNRL